MGGVLSCIELVVRNSGLCLSMSHEAVFAVPHSETLSCTAAVFAQ